MRVRPCKDPLRPIVIIYYHPRTALAYVVPRNSHRSCSFARLERERTGEPEAAGLELPGQPYIAQPIAAPLFLSALHFVLRIPSSHDLGFHGYSD
jgi:hypothetical protein